MKNKVIVVVGSPGRLIEALLKKMQESAMLLGKKYDIYSDSTVKINNQLTSKEHPNIDVLLLAPQLAFMKDKLVQKSKVLGIAVGVLSISDYSLSLGVPALLTAEQVMRSENEKDIN
jgi:cellobiose-specific phosphotransferase system component IIB